jgi:RND superfamily putative drug exporter
VVNVFSAIGRFAVRFRWFIVAAWVAAAFVISSVLPSLSSVTQSNNGSFLPSSSPSAHASNLASPFQKSGQASVEVIVYRAAGTLTPGDTGAIARVITDLRAVPNVAGVKDLGRSAGGNAENLQVLAASTLSSGPGGGTGTFVGDLRSATAKASLPSGLQAHTAGSTADQVDNQKKSGSTGSNIELLSELFIVVLLFIIFRSLLAPFVTLLPAVLVYISPGRSSRSSPTPGSRFRAWPSS